MSSPLRPKLYVIAHGAKNNQSYDHFLKKKFSSYNTLSNQFDIQLCYAKSPPYFNKVFIEKYNDHQYVLPFFMSSGVIVQKYVLPVLHTLSESASSHVTLLPAIGSNLGSILALGNTIINHCQSALHHHPFVPSSFPDILKKAGLAIVGHGSTVSNSNQRTVDMLTERLKCILPFKEVNTFYLEQPPYFDTWPQSMTSEIVFVFPMMLTLGKHLCQDIHAIKPSSSHHPFKWIHILPSYGEIGQFEAVILQTIQQATMSENHHDR